MRQEPKLVHWPVPRPTYPRESGQEFALRERKQAWRVHRQALRPTFRPESALPRPKRALPAYRRRRVRAGCRRPQAVRG